MHVYKQVNMIEYSCDKNHNRKKGRSKLLKNNEIKHIQITFSINENLYHNFKVLCNAERKKPATILTEFIKNYTENRKEDNYEN